MTQSNLIEKLAALEHEQWMHWASAVSPEVSPDRAARWRKYLVPYDQLPEDVKEHDRVWARKALEMFKEAFFGVY
jgi:hypothetical protein